MPVTKAQFKQLLVEEFESILETLDSKIAAAPDGQLALEHNRATAILASLEAVSTDESAVDYSDDVNDVINPVMEEIKNHPHQVSVGYSQEFMDVIAALCMENI